MFITDLDREVVVEKLIHDFDLNRDEAVFLIKNDKERYVWKWGTYNQITKFYYLVYFYSYISLEFR